MCLPVTLVHRCRARADRGVVCGRGGRVGGGAIVAHGPSPVGRLEDDPPIIVRLSAIFAPVGSPLEGDRLLGGPRLRRVR